MSEDEIIERVNKFINITVLYGKTYGMTCDDLKKYQQVFQGLLDLYNKEKEKNTGFEKQWVSIDDYNELKRQVKIKNEYLSLITGTGFDYDGEDGSIEGLKSVIDQLVDYARKAIDNDDKSVIYGIFDDDVKRNVLLEPIEIPEPLEKPFEEIDNHIPRID